MVRCRCATITARTPSALTRVVLRSVGSGVGRSGGRIVKVRSLSVPGLEWRVGRG